MQVVILIFGAFTFILIMLLPAFLELKRPKDAGPRIIAGCMPEMPSKTRAAIIVNMERDEKFDQTLTKKIADILSVLPNLEG